jgi:hypothetical protein
MKRFILFGSDRLQNAICYRHGQTMQSLSLSLYLSFFLSLTHTPTLSLSLLLSGLSIILPDVFFFFWPKSVRAFLTPLTERGMIARPASCRKLLLNDSAAVRGIGFGQTSLSPLMHLENERVMKIRLLIWF